MCLYLVNVWSFVCTLSAVFIYLVPWNVFLYADFCLCTEVALVGGYDGSKTKILSEREHYIEMAKKKNGQWHPFLDVKSECHATCHAASVVTCLEECRFCLSLVERFFPATRDWTQSLVHEGQVPWYDLYSLWVFPPCRGIYTIIRVKQGATERRHY